MAEFTDDDVARVLRVLHSLPDAEKLDVFARLWLTVASRARVEALATPGGFAAERVRQLTILLRLTDLVAGDEPDLDGMARSAREQSHAPDARERDDIGSGSHG